MIFAVVKNNKIENIIEAEPDAPFGQIFPDADAVIEANENSGIPIIGLGVRDGKFQQFASWTFDESLGEWVAPEPKPEGDYFWNEDTLSWIEIELPTVEEENA